MPTGAGVVPSPNVPVLLVLPWIEPGTVLHGPPSGPYPTLEF
jgi:phospholipase C